MLNKKQGISSTAYSSAYPSTHCAIGDPVCKITDCALSGYTNCIDITNDGSYVIQATFGYSFIPDGYNYTVKYACSGSGYETNPLKQKPGFFYAVNTLNGQSGGFDCDGTSTSRTCGRQGSPIDAYWTYTENGESIIKLDWLYLKDNNLLGKSDLYLHIGCLRVNSFDTFTYYMLAQDYILFNPYELLDQCNIDSDCQNEILVPKLIPATYKDVAWCKVRCRQDGTDSWFGNNCSGWADGCGGNKCIWNPDGTCKDSGYTEIRKEIVTPEHYEEFPVKLFNDNIQRTCVNKKCVVPPTCSDGIKNQDETGIDCGGVCTACACVPNNPCAANTCIGSTCFDGCSNIEGTKICTVAPSCSDGIKNQDETGVDCGGVCQSCGCSEGLVKCSDGSCRETCSIPCVDINWTGDVNTTCNTNSVVQTSNCGKTRTVAGTKDCTCHDTTWSPDLSLTCKGTNVTQKSDCNATRINEGTKDCPENPDNTIYYVVGGISAVGLIWAAIKYKIIGG